MEQAASAATGSAELSLKPDLSEAKQRWLAFWEHEIIDRPLCAITAPAEGAAPVAAPKYMAGAREGFGPVVRQALAWVQSRYWGGEAIPCYSPSFGPDLFAAWLGSELEFPKQETGTSWAHTCIERWEQALPISLDPDNPWWRRMLDFCAALAEAFEGKALVAHLDLHSNMDALLAMRGGERLCTDLLDVPEVIDRAMRDVRALYAPIDLAIREAGQMTAGAGACGRIPVYHPERTNTIQCDFLALIGPAHARRWVIPALEEEAAHLGHTIMHYDGPQCLVHLDDACAVPGIDCIQWQPGAGNKPFIEWMRLLKEIQSKGLAVHVPCNTQDIKLYHRELKPNLVYYHCSAPSRAAAEETLAWLAANT